MSTPELQLRTLFELDGEGRIPGTRESVPRARPLFSLTRGRKGCAWTVRADLARNMAGALNGLAEEEPPVADFRQAPVQAQRSVEGTGARLEGSAVGPGLLAAGVVRGVVGRVTTALRQGVKEAAFRHVLCIVGTLMV